MLSTDPAPPSTSSALYKTLHATALTFIHSHDKTEDASRLNVSRIRAVRTANFTHSWGHNYFVSTNPHMQGTRDLDSFITHMQGMLPLLESWDTEVKDAVVDEAKRMVVVRASYWMKVKGADTVENDLLWWLWMEESGEKVERAMEFMDAEATRRIREIMMKAKE